MTAKPPNERQATAAEWRELGYRAVMRLAHPTARTEAMYRKKLLSAWAANMRLAYPNSPPSLVRNPSNPSPLKRGRKAAAVNLNSVAGAWLERVK